MGGGQGGSSKRREKGTGRGERVAARMLLRGGAMGAARALGAQPCCRLLFVLAVLFVKKKKRRRKERRKRKGRKKGKT
jgi:hypothetical protein